MATDVDEVMLTRLVEALNDCWNGAVEAGYENLDEVSGRNIMLEIVIPAEFVRSNDENALTSVCEVAAEVIATTNCDDEGRIRKEGRRNEGLTVFKADKIGADDGGYDDKGE